MTIFTEGRLAAWLAIGSLTAAAGVQCEAATPTYCILGPSVEMPNHRNVQLQLKVGGSAYFQMVPARSRRSEENIVPYMFTNGGEFVFTLDVESDPTYIRTQGTDGYVSVNYQTVPPSIIEREKPDDTSEWHLIRHPIDCGKDDGYYIQNADLRGKDLWLGVDDETVSRPVKNEELVVDYKKAILSKDKTCMTVQKRPGSK